MSAGKVIDAVAPKAISAEAVKRGPPAIVVSSLSKRLPHWESPTRLAGANHPDASTSTGSPTCSNVSLHAERSCSLVPGQLKQHPLCAAFPTMSADDFQSLMDDMEAHGQREPIMLFEGMVLDGWHRYRACIELGMKPTQFNFNEEDDPVSFVISHNLHRRHLTASQRAAAVVSCSKWAPSGRPKKVETVSTFSKNKDLAKAAGTTTRTITDAKTAQSAGLSDVVRDGGMTANQAANVAKGKTGKPRKPRAKPKATAPEPEPEFTGPEADELAANESAARADMEALQKLLDSDDKLATAYAEIKRLNAELAVVKVARNGYMNQCNELIKSVKSLQRKLDKATA